MLGEIARQKIKQRGWGEATVSGVPFVRYRCLLNPGYDGHNVTEIRCLRVHSSFDFIVPPLSLSFLSSEFRLKSLKLRVTRYHARFHGPDSRSAWE